MTNVTCHAKHTTYQPPDDKWRCPKCGNDTKAGADFYIEEGAEDANPNCELLHAKDYLICNACAWGGTGASVAKSLASQDHRETCPHCKGAGTVPKP